MNIMKRRVNRGPLRWWYRLAVSPDTETSVLQNEARRRGQLVSLVLLVLLLASVCAIPVFLYDGEQDLLVVIGMVIFCTGIALFLNRMGKSTSAGVIVTLLLCGSIVFDLVTTPLLRTRDLPEFDLLLLSELAAVSLVSARSVFILAAINCAFIGLMLTFHPLSPELELVIAQDSLYAVLFRTVTLQIAVAIVLYLWVRTARLAIVRADRAEVTVAAQHRLLEQSRTVAREKRQVDENIQRIMQALAHSSNDPSTRIAYSQADPLWQSMHMVNLFLARLQHARATDDSLMTYKESVDVLIQRVHRLRTQHGQEQLQLTGTLLDPLVGEMNALLAEYVFTRHSSPRVPGKRALHGIKKTHLCPEQPC